MPKLPIQLPDEQRLECTRLGDALSPAFAWSKTPQGRNYWEEVRRNLYALASFTVYPYNEETGEPGELVAELPYDDAVAGDGDPPDQNDDNEDLEPL